MSTKNETETVITWTLADEFATVYSMMPKIWRQCERAGGRKVASTTREGKEASRTYLVSPNALRISGRRKRELTSEAREALRARLTRARAHN